MEGSANLSELEAQYQQLMQEQWNVDRAYNYQVSRDAIGDARYDKEVEKCALTLVENLKGWTGEKERQYG